MAYIYIVRCEDGSLYTGITKHIRARMKAHITGTGKAKYTRSRKICELCALWTCNEYRDAARLEYALKTLTRSKKLELIDNPENVNGMFEKLGDVHFEKGELFDISELIPNGGDKIKQKSRKISNDKIYLSRQRKRENSS